MIDSLIRSLSVLLFRSYDLVYPCYFLSRARALEQWNYIVVYTVFLSTSNLYHIHEQDPAALLFSSRQAQAPPPLSDSCCLWYSND